MIAYGREKILQVLKFDFVRFCIVGGTGFLINLAILMLLTKQFNTPVFIAQLIGAEIALGSNFVLHHNWTYRNRRVKKSLPNLIIQFHASSWPAIIGSTLLVSLMVTGLHTNKIEALVVSSVVALAWNFAWSKYVIWRNIETKEVEEIAS